MADVVAFPKRFTSYEVVYHPYLQSASYRFTMQCPVDKVEEFLTFLLPPNYDTCYYFNVTGVLADGNKEFILGDDWPRGHPNGKHTVKHTGIICPGTQAADTLQKAMLKIVISDKPSATVAPASAPADAIRVGHTISKEEWDKFLDERYGTKSTPATPTTTPAVDRLDVFPVACLTSISIEELK